MIFVNLLPDIKVEYIRSLRIKRLLVLLSVILITCCIIINSVLYFVTEIQQPAAIREKEGYEEGAETKVVADPAAETDEENQTTADPPAEGEEATSENTSTPATGTPKEIKPANSNEAIIQKIENAEGIQNILTIQSKLDTLPSLREDKIAADRLFADEKAADDLAYLDVLVPAQDEINTIESINFDFVMNSFTITGETKDAKSAVVLFKSIQYAGFKECTLDTIGTRIYPFRVDESTVKSQSSTGNDDPIPYSISGTFSNKLFDDQVDEKYLPLVVPEEFVANPDIFQPDHRCGDPPTGDDRLHPETS